LVVNGMYYIHVRWKFIERKVELVGKWTKGWGAGRIVCTVIRN
jgi:hypothetical protein